MMNQVEPEKGRRTKGKQSWTCCKGAIFHVICEKEETFWQLHKSATHVCMNDARVNKHSYGAK